MLDPPAWNPMAVKEGEATKSHQKTAVFWNPRELALQLTSSEPPNDFLKHPKTRCYWAWRPFWRLEKQYASSAPRIAGRARLAGPAVPAAAAAAAAGCCCCVEVGNSYSLARAPPCCRPGSADYAHSRSCKEPWCSHYSAIWTTIGKASAHVSAHMAT